MQTMPPIVAATDFSSEAGRAALRAALIARQQDAELHLLHVTAPLALYPGQEVGPADGAVISAVLGEQAEATARVLRERYDIRVTVAQRIGRAHSQIAVYAAEVGAGLVVVGARGQSTLLRLLLGSTAWRLLRVCQLPVLIVRGEPIAPYGRVLAAVDFFPHSRVVVAWARRLAADGHLRVLHAPEPLDESGLRSKGLDGAAIKQHREEMRAIAENLMANLRADLPREVESHIEPGYPPTRILESASDWSADLIVLGRQGRGGLEDFLLGSVSKDVAQEADCDVLLVGERNQ
ncbi:MAG: universal stress protein [Betaproteobacteria bacterium]|nr:universal stress protein [Betaproteobacteria bacterium]